MALCGWEVRVRKGGWDGHEEGLADLLESSVGASLESGLWEVMIAKVHSLWGAWTGWCMCTEEGPEKVWSEGWIVARCM